MKPQTSFRFDMMPWKLVFCDRSVISCSSPQTAITLDKIPPALEPGRIPTGADHLHIVVKLSGERDAREDEKWRALAKSITRCEHGRIMRSPCRRCPAGIAPDMTGERIGTTKDKLPIVVPPYTELDDIRAWTTSANSSEPDNV